MRVIAALFDAPVPARAAVRALLAAGLGAADITTIPSLPGAILAEPGLGGGAAIDAGTDEAAGGLGGAEPPEHRATGAPDDPTGLTERLVALGAPYEDATRMGEGVRRGAIVLVAAVPTLEAPAAARAIAAALPCDLDAAAAAWSADPELRYRWRDIAPPELAASPPAV